MNSNEQPIHAQAFPPTTADAPTASWHPALRSDNNTNVQDDEDDDFFERYPGATPKKAQAQITESVEERSLEDREESTLEATSQDLITEEQTQSISTEQVIESSFEQAALDTSQSVSIHDAETQSQLPEAEDLDVEARDQEEPIFHEHETVAEQEQDLEQLMPETTVEEALFEADVSVAQQAQPDLDEPPPEENYEHQGEVTEMEEAQEPSADAPLLDDAEPAAATFEGSRDTLLGTVGGEATTDFESLITSQDTLETPGPAPGQLDRSFTTNFMEPVLPQQVESQSKRPLSVDWPDVGDDKTFGEILDAQEARPTELNTLEEVAAEESIDEAAPDAEAALDDDLLPDDDNEEDMAAAWKAALDDDELLTDEPLADESSVFDPSIVFGDDDDGFLLDDDVPALPSTPAQQASSAPKNQYTPANAQQSQRSVQSAQPVDAFHGRSAGTPQTGLYDVYNQPGATQQPQRPAPSTAQSFSDKAKGGYQSPYDLPMEVVKPRRRPQAPPQQSASGPVAAPPPRSSSYSSQAQQAAGPPGPPSVTSLSPPTSSHANSQVPSGLASKPSKPTPQADSGFFADLPMTTKPRARVSGAYTPQQTGAPASPQGPMPPPQQFASRPPQAPQPPMSTGQATRQVPPPQMPPQSDAYAGLRPPERMPLLPDQSPSQAPEAAPAPAITANSRYSPNPQAATNAPGTAVSNRYSPAPTTQPSQSGASRYSPAPGAQPGQTRPRYASATSGLPFAPRTSSPLAAFTDRSSQGVSAEGAQGLSSSPSKMNGARYMQQETGSSASGYAPSMAELTPPGSESSSGPPPQQSSRTVSPSAFAKRPMVRSAASDRPSPAGLPASQPAAQPKRTVLPHRRKFSRSLAFAPPQHEGNQDAFERWKGSPVFHWNASGTVLSSFPKQLPLYTGGEAMPVIKCNPGSITMQDISSFMPIADLDAKFPGPLTARSKGKKKEVLAWMNEKVTELERHTERVTMDFSLPSDEMKRVEEKLVLWKIARIFVEHDGTLEGNPKIDEEVRKILLPNLAQMGQVLDLPHADAGGANHYPIDRSVLLQLRLALLEGQRERAVWLAEEKKLWGHAMLIASTMGPDVWKQIIQSFIRTQVKGFGSDARCLAALYQVFAGNTEECIDELVPPSARAGFQMISKADGSMSGNPLEGLDQWRETLSLVTSNRTATDGPSLVALGKLLSSYGRAEAAHTCFLFARSFAKHSGADDAEANFVLLGSNHKPQDETFGNDLDSIMLTEIYEWASSLTMPSTAVPYIPHLQSYKLLHAQELSTRGLKTRAQAYCDHITTAYTSTTRPSQYYHPVFTQSVAEFSAMLSQSPQDGKAGFLSRPALKTVTTSANSWFNRFVAGDDDKASDGTGAGGPGEEDMPGPFGRVVGESPSISRAASVTNLYNPMMGDGMPIQTMAPGAQQQSFAPSSAPSSMPTRYTPLPNHAAQGNARYAPSSGLSVAPSDQSRPSSSRYAPAAPAQQQQGMPSGLQPQAQTSHPEISRATSDYTQPYAPSPNGSRPPSGQRAATYAPTSSLSPPQTSNYEPSPAASYQPQPVLAAEPVSFGYSPQIPPQMLPQPQTLAEEAEPAGLMDPVASQEVAPEIDAEGGSGGYEPPSGGYEAPTGGYEAPTGGYEPPTGGYEPPTSGYEAPSYSYQPYEPEPESPEDEKPKPKKKMFGDDDEDKADEIAKRAAALKKSQADREADDAFRKAAEADAARDKGGDPNKKGWFGGWFGGAKKDPNAAPGPIRAKLGEESSFVYDETLKKWVNKKGGSEAATPSAPTPPPPRAGPPGSRVTSMSSAAGGPPSGPPSRVPSGAAVLGMPDSQSAAGLGMSAAAAATPPMAGSGPPSRIGTPSTNPTPMAHPPPGVMNGEMSASGPPSRAASGMSNASSLDDLLGGPPGASARKAGGAKAKKKGGRYVDVMAK